MSTRGKKTNGGSSEDEAAALGATISRLRKAYNMSLGDLSEQSGVAKSIISQIERNETNPTLATVVKLSRALDTTIDEVLRGETKSLFLEHQTKSGVPMLESQDGKCRLAIAGPLNLIETFQWYDFHAQVGGVLESSPHPPGTIEPGSRRNRRHHGRRNQILETRRGPPLQGRCTPQDRQYGWCGRTCGDDFDIEAVWECNLIGHSPVKLNAEAEGSDLEARIGVEAGMQIARASGLTNA
jgi:XRE family transcriptional regulator, regulator of sulfur utilization